MKTFYKIIDNKAHIGSGNVVPSGFIEYNIEQKPIELINGLNYKTVNEAKLDKLVQIIEDYKTAESQPVTYNGVQYNGGDESATSIDKYVRLNRLAGATSHTIWGYDNMDNTLTDAQADELILAIGYQASQNKFNAKNRKVALRNAQSITEVEAI